MAGISESNRQLLTKLHRYSSGVVDIEETAGLLGINRNKASKLLAHLASQGWARRLRRGLYLLIPLEATSPQDWTADPWVIADQLFRPGYIAGWSACEHWGFTEQIFRDICVFTSSSIRSRKLVVDQITYALRKISINRFFGLRGVWREGVRILISDPTRTIIDILDTPKWGGGIRHVYQILEEYLNSEHKDEKLIEEYLRRIGNSAAAKRLGYLWETMNGVDTPILQLLQTLIASGYSLLDPTVTPRGPYIARWKLRLNVGVE